MWEIAEEAKKNPFATVGQTQKGTWVCVNANKEEKASPECHRCASKAGQACQPKKERRVGKWDTDQLLPDERRIWRQEETAQDPKLTTSSLKLVGMFWREQVWLPLDGWSDCWQQHQGEFGRALGNDICSYSAKYLGAHQTTSNGMFRKGKVNYLKLCNYIYIKKITNQISGRNW